MQEKVSLINFRQENALGSVNEKMKKNNAIVGLIKMQAYLGELIIYYSTR